MSSILDLTFSIASVNSFERNGDGLVRFLTMNSRQPQRRHTTCSVRFLPDVVVAQHAPVSEFLAGKDEALLIRRGAFLILDIALQVLNSIRSLDLERNGFAVERVVEACMPTR